MELSGSVWAGCGWMVWAGWFGLDGDGWMGMDGVRWMDVAYSESEDREKQLGGRSIHLLATGHIQAHPHISLVCILGAVMPHLS